MARVDRLQSIALEVLSIEVLGGGHTHVGDHAPVDGECGKAPTAAMVSECIDEGVRGAVVRRALVAQHGRHGGEAHEMVELQSLRLLVKIPRTNGLGSEC